MKEKNFKLKYILYGAVITGILALPAALLFSSSARVLVTGTEAEFYKAKTILLTGRVFICLKDSKTYKSKKLAMESREEDYKFAMVPTGTISMIEIIREDEKKIGTDVPAQVPGIYLGNYSIVALGHNGFLNIGMGKEGLYGSLRFPNWGNGVWEYLREVNISGNKVVFTRAITTQAELKRTGAQSYFTQKYYGEYAQNGDFIRGFYTVNAVRSPWEAKRVK